MNRETSKQNMTAEKPSQSDLPELNDLRINKDVTGGAPVVREIPVSKPVDDKTSP